MCMICYLKAQAQATTGDDVYTLNPLETRTLPLMDGGGIDMLNASLYSSSVTLDLREGAENLSYLAEKSFALAFGANIENARGGSGDDAIHGNALANLLFGNQGSDTINGDLGDDLVRGGKGNDVINGGQGDDTLVGDAGDDVLTGGEGSDTFQFYATHSGNDIVTDFTPGEDKLALQGWNVDAETIGEFISFEDGNTVLTLAGGDVITLVGVSPAELSAGDFLFT